MEVVSAGVEELDEAEEFGEVDGPVLFVVVGTVGRARGIAGSGGESIFGAGLEW